MFDELTLSQLLGISKPLASRVAFSRELSISLPAALTEEHPTVSTLCKGEAEHLFQYFALIQSHQLVSCL